MDSRGKKRAYDEGVWGGSAKRRTPAPAPSASPTPEVVGAGGSSRASRTPPIGTSSSTATGDKASKKGSKTPGHDLHSAVCALWHSFKLLHNSSGEDGALEDFKRILEAASPEGEMVRMER